jgi:hypothetical protein
LDSEEEIDMATDSVSVPSSTGLVVLLVVVVAVHMIVVLKLARLLDAIEHEIEVIHTLQ